MSTYETTATVEDKGQVRVAGVPFAPGTEVDVTISRKPQSHEKATPGEDERDDERAASGLRWEGNVLVHQGVGVGASVTDLRDERLNRLGEGRSG